MHGSACILWWMLLPKTFLLIGMDGCCFVCACRSWSQFGTLILLCVCILHSWEISCNDVNKQTNIAPTQSHTTETDTCSSVTGWTHLCNRSWACHTKILAWENFGKFDKMSSIHQNILIQFMANYTEYIPKHYPTNSASSSIVWYWQYQQQLYPLPSNTHKRTHIHTHAERVTLLMCPLQSYVDLPLASLKGESLVHHLQGESSNSLRKFHYRHDLSRWLHLSWQVSWWQTHIYMVTGIWHSMTGDVEQSTSVHH